MTLLFDTRAPIDPIDAANAPHRLTARRTNHHAMFIQFEKLPEFRKLSARARLKLFTNKK
jgi:hypothetical protein